MCADTHYSYSAQKTARTLLLYSPGAVCYSIDTVMHRQHTQGVRGIWTIRAGLRNGASACVTKGKKRSPSGSITTPSYALRTWRLYGTQPRQRWSSRPWPNFTLGTRRVSVIVLIQHRYRHSCRTWYGQSYRS